MESARFGNPASRTSATLLARLKVEPGNSELWWEFVERYSPKVFAWCRQWGLQERMPRTRRRS